MIISIRFGKDIPVEIASALGTQCHVTGPEVQIFNIENNPVLRYFELISRWNKAVIFGPYFLPEGTPDWLSPDIVGAVLGPGEVQVSLNQKEDYYPVWPEHCSGIVKNGLPIESSYRPKRHVELVGDNLILSKRISEMIGDENLILKNPVKSKGQLISNWACYEVRQKNKCIDPCCFELSGFCNVCGAPYVSWRGIWVGELPPGSAGQIWEEEAGYEHVRSRKPIVVSKDLAYELQDSLGHAGFQFMPIFDKSSTFGTYIVQLCNYFSSIER